MEHVDTPVPALVTQPAAGDGLFVPAAAARPDRPIPAPFAGLRWRFVPEPARPGRPHAKP
ncbi:hypothetical protein DVDV_3726 [Desulfovibrio sp. DV]|uniref:hypothetical protein n=1 Tax=Desulfovibrio sp. DV TaxID=1844708 RepID=UPI00094B8237|nr:hypothetical protein [Desulfovibrio sp. DV]OLN25008.1 hypothetical protein DVDV_3726 [Desulfovibrio sp. DV]